jgi:hypothetical protein
MGTSFGKESIEHPESKPKSHCQKEHGTEKEAEQKQDLVIVENKVMMDRVGYVHRMLSVHEREAGSNATPKNLAVGAKIMAR